METMDPKEIDKVETVKETQTQGETSGKECQNYEEFEEKVISEWTERKAMDLIRDMEAYYEANQGRFLLIDYLGEKKVNKNVPIKLRNRFPAFAEEFAHLRTRLESRICQFGTQMRNPAFVVFLAKNHYDYVDKQEISQNTTITLDYGSNILGAWNDRLKSVSLPSLSPKTAIPPRTSDLQSDV